MLTEEVIQHVVESLREAYTERGWSHRDLDSLDRLIRRRADQINALVGQIQGWSKADEAEYDVLCTLLGHLPSVHLSFENPFMMQMRIPLGELFLTLSDTIHDNGELEGFEVVPNDCAELAAREASAAEADGKRTTREAGREAAKEAARDLKDDDLRLFRKAFEDS